jgi:hypothetical protein
VILKLFAERVRQPSESPDAHSHRQVLTFHMAGADVLRVGLAYAYHHFSAHHFCRGVAPLAFGSRAIHLDELREVHPVIQRVSNGRTVRSEAVSSDLKSLL